MLGLVWFCDEVLPKVQQVVPEVRLAIVGRHPVAEVVALAGRSGVDVHSDVPQMAPWFEWARAVVVPLHVGTGTRLKALEAMAAARPLVGTSVGLEGLGIIDGVQACVVDDPSAMAAALIEILRDDVIAAASRRGWPAVRRGGGAVVRHRGAAGRPARLSGFESAGARRDVGVPPG